MLRPLRSVTIAVVAALMLAGCQDAVSVGDVNEAAQRLDQELASYLQIAATEPPIDTPAQAREFFSNSAEKLANLRNAYTEWAVLLEESIAQGNTPEDQSSEDLQSYSEAADAWIRAQEQQLTLSRDCFSSRAVSNGTALRCYRDMFEEHGADWQATADRLNNWRR